MTIKYKIIPGLKTLYLKGTGKVTIDEILTTGANIFSERDWTNGFNILIDNSGITELDVTTEDIRKIVEQQKINEPLFDKSKCAVVAVSNLVYGISRMWISHSSGIKIPAMIYRKMEDSLRWLDLNESVLQSFEMQ